MSFTVIMYKVFCCKSLLVLGTKKELDCLPTAEPDSFPGSQDHIMSLEMMLLLRSLCIQTCALLFCNINKYTFWKGRTIGDQKKQIVQTNTCTLLTEHFLVLYLSHHSWKEHVSKACLCRCFVQNKNFWPQFIGVRHRYINHCNMSIVTFCVISYMRTHSYCELSYRQC